MATSRGPQGSKSKRGSAPKRSGSSQRTTAAKPRSQTARERSAAFRVAERRAEQRRRWLVRGGSVIAVLVVAAAIVIGVVLSGHHSAPSAATHDVAKETLNGPPGPEGIPLEEGQVLAPLSTAAQGAPVDGITCDTNEQVAYHIHTHVSVFVNGALRPIPAGIGIVKPVPQQTKHGKFYSASHCYYWLHMHAQDGIIHIEAPSSATYTLGQFFDIWNQQLTTNTVASAHGKVTVFVNGQRFTGNPRNITLKSHEDIQIDVGQVVSPKKIDWSKSGL